MTVVSPGQSLHSPHFVSGQTVDVQSGGTLFAGTLEAGVLILAGVDRGTVLDGGSETILAGGSSAEQTVLADGTTWLSGGVASHTIVAGAAAALSVDGGRAVGTVVDGGGELVLLSGTADSTTIDSGSFIADGGIVSALLLSGSGAVGSASGAAVHISNVMVAGGATLSVAGGTTIDALHISGGTAVIGPDVSANFIVFEGKSDLLDLPDGVPAGLGPIAGLAVGDAIEFDRSLWSNGITAVFARDTLVVNAGGLVTEITLAHGATSGLVPFAEEGQSGAIGIVFEADRGFHGTTSVTAGETLVGVDVASGVIYVLSSGVALDATIGPTGFATVSAGGVLSGGQVFSTGFADALSGGLLRGVQVGSVGFDTISSGGSALDTVVLPSGSEWVDAGGIAIGTRISGGRQYVIGDTSDGASDTRVTDGGEQIVEGGAVAVGTVVATTTVVVNHLTTTSAGTVEVQLGAVLSNATASGGDIVISGGSAIGTLFRGGGAEVLGGSIESSVVEQGGILLDQGGVASDTVLGSGEFMEILDGVADGVRVAGTVWPIFGTLENATVLAGGVISSLLDQAMLLSSIRVEASGTLITQGTADSVMVGGAGAQAFVGGLASGGWVSGGGTVTVSSGDTLLDERVRTGGTLVMQAGASGSGLKFGEPDATLVLGGTSDTAGVLSHAVAGDTVDLAGLAWVAGASATFLSHQMLAVSAGGTVFDLALALGSNVSALAPVVSDAGGAVAVVFAPVVPGGGALVSAGPGSAWIVGHS